MAVERLPTSIKGELSYKLHLGAELLKFDGSTTVRNLDLEDGMIIYVEPEDADMTPALFNVTFQKKLLTA